jgi:hypothetical protein
MAQEGDFRNAGTRILPTEFGDDVVLRAEAIPFDINATALVPSFSYRQSA